MWADPLEGYKNKLMLILDNGYIYVCSEHAFLAAHPITGDYFMISITAGDDDIENMRKQGLIEY